MAVTYTMSRLQTTNTDVVKKSILSAALLSAASTGAEVATIVHRLTACPHEVRLVLRSLVAGGSSAPIAAVRSWNASQIIVDFQGSPLTGLVAGVYDVIAETVHTFVM